MIDEGHDFESAWLHLVTQMTDPDRIPYSCSMSV